LKLSYNFRLGPEALWLIVNTVVGTVLIELLGDLSGLTTFPGWDNINLWLSALALSAVRTFLGALLAAATGGGFQVPGEPKPPAA
jgi:hypothetical protein